MNLKSAARLLFAACLIAVLPSCTGIPGEYGGTSYGGYDSGYSSYGDGYSGYSSRPVYGGGGYGGGYYGGGYSQPYYPRYRSPHYSHDDHGHYTTQHSSSRYDYDRGRSSGSHSSGSHSNSRSGGEAIRLVKVRDGTRGNVPQGYHSKEYFKNRGISLSKNVYETRDGDRRGHSGSSSSSSKKKGR